MDPLPWWQKAILAFVIVGGLFGAHMAHLEWTLQRECGATWAS